MNNIEKTESEEFPRLYFGIIFGIFFIALAALIFLTIAVLEIMITEFIAEGLSSRVLSPSIILIIFWYAYIKMLNGFHVLYYTFRLIISK